MLLGGLAQAQQSATGQGLPVRVDDPPGLGADGHAEPGAAFAQSVERRFDGTRIRRQKPCSESQDQPGGTRFHAVAVEGEGEVALDDGLATPRPRDDDLPLGTEQHLGPVFGAAQGVEIGDEFALTPGPASALAQGAAGTGSSRR